MLERRWQRSRRERLPKDRTSSRSTVRRRLPSAGGGGQHGVGERAAPACDACMASEMIVEMRLSRPLGFDPLASGGGDDLLDACSGRDGARVDDTPSAPESTRKHSGEMPRARQHCHLWNPARKRAGTGRPRRGLKHPAKRFGTGLEQAHETPLLEVWGQRWGLRLGETAKALRENPERGSPAPGYRAGYRVGQAGDSRDAGRTAAVHSPRRARKTGEVWRTGPVCERSASRAWGTPRASHRAIYLEGRAPDRPPRKLLRVKGLGDKLGYPRATFVPPLIFSHHP